MNDLHYQFRAFESEDEEASNASKDIEETPSNAMDSSNQQARLDYFRGPNCRIPVSQIKAMMARSLPPNFSPGNNASFITSHLVRVFVAELVELARSLSDKTGPLTPDEINMAFIILEERKKIPGAGPGSDGRRNRIH